VLIFKYYPDSCHKPGIYWRCETKFDLLSGSTNIRSKMYHGRDKQIFNHLNASLMHQPPLTRLSINRLMETAASKTYLF